MKTVQPQKIMPLLVMGFLFPLFAMPINAHYDHRDFFRAGEFLIDSTITYLPAAGITPATCFDGINYLTVWIDDSPENYTEIRGTRISQNGIVIDSASLCLSHVPTIQSNPSVAFGATTYLIVWSDNRSGNYDIYGTRVSSTGAVLDIDNILIASSEHDLLAPAVTYGGSSFFVIWKEHLTPTNGYIRGTRVSESGIVLDTIITINNIPIAQIPPSVAFDGKNFFAVWAISTYLFGARIDTVGLLIDTTSIQIATNPGYKNNPVISFDGTNYLTVWQDNRNASFDIFGARIDTAGTVLDPQGLPIITSSEDLWDPALTFTGVTYLLVWNDSRAGNSGIYAARVNTDGVALDTNGVAISDTTFYKHDPALAYNGMADLLVTWAVDDNGIAGSRIDTSCALIDSFPLAISINLFSQWNPALAFNGNQYLVAWHDGRNGTDFNVYAARIDTGGAVLDDTPIPVATQVVYQQLPAVAASPINYLIAWQDDRFANVYAARVDTAGILLDPTGFPITTANHEQEAPAAVFDGAKYFVVWHDRRGGSVTNIYGTRVTTSGTVLNPAGIRISYASGVDDRYPAISSNGTYYVIAWNRYPNTLVAACTDTSGTIIDTMIIATTLSPDASPSVATDGTGFLILWQDTRNIESDVYAARLDSSGTVLDSAGIRLSVAAGDQMRPTAAWDGTYYTVIWEDYEHNVSDLSGARVANTGSLFNRFPLVTDEGNQFAPAVVRGTDEDLLLSYAGFADSMGTKQINAIRIWGSLFIPPAGISEWMPPRDDNSSLLAFSMNPSRATAAISYTVVREGEISLAVFDAAGRKVRSLIHSRHQPGRYRIIWDGKDEAGKVVQSGIYFVVLQGGTSRCVRKAVLFR